MNVPIRCEDESSLPNTFLSLSLSMRGVSGQPGTVTI